MIIKTYKPLKRHKTSFKAYLSNFKSLNLIRYLFDHLGKMELPMKTHLNQEEINRQIGQAIAKYRQQKGFTQEQIAEILNIGSETVSRMERGLIMPNVMRIIELADIFDCSAADLLGDNSHRLLDQSNKIALLIARLNIEDRKLVMDFLESLVNRLQQSS